MAGLPCVKGCGCFTERLIDLEDDGKKVALCVYCEDGVPCKAAEMQGDAPPAVLAQSSRKIIIPGKRKASPPAEVPITAARVVSQIAPRVHRKRAEAEIMKDKKNCRHPGCSKMTTAESGCCSTHWYWGTKNPPGESSPEKESRKDVPRKTNPLNITPPDLAAVYLSAAALDRIWNGSSLAEKAAMITDYMAKVLPA